MNFKQCTISQIYHKMCHLRDVVFISKTQYIKHLYTMGSNIYKNLITTWTKITDKREDS